MEYSRDNSTSNFLMSIVRILSSSVDYEEREKEKARIEISFSECDKKLSNLVTDKYEDLSKILQAFTNIYKNISDSREKIKTIKEDLNSCKTLLSCKRDELRRLWIEGLEHKTFVSLLDQIEEIKEVGDKLDSFISTKHYLHATDLIVNAVAKLENTLANVGALKDLRTELHARKEQLYSILIDELQRQIYFKSTAPPIIEYQRNDANRGKDHANSSFASRDKSKAIQTPQMVGYAVDTMQVREDLNNKNPEQDMIHFVSVIVECLFVLRKLPDAVLSLQMGMRHELSSLVSRTSKIVSDNVVTQQNESLSQVDQPRNLLELLDVLLEQMSRVINLHQVITTNIEKKTKSGSRGDILKMYNITDVWSMIQAVLQMLIEEYLDVNNSSNSRSQTMGHFNEINSDINSYFSKKKSGKSKKVSLFRFEASLQAISMNTYLQEQKTFDPDQILLGAQSSADVSRPPLVCKPCPENITIVYVPLKKYILKIENSIQNGKRSSSLQSFLMDFIKKTFLGKVDEQITYNISAVTKGIEVLRNIIEKKIQMEMNLPCPLLQSAVTIQKNQERLLELIGSLPDYTDEFLNMIRQIFQEYHRTCSSAYMGIVQYDSDDKRIISAMWSKDEDINRFLRSLPSWQGLQPGGQKLSLTVLSEAELQAVFAKESLILISNLADTNVGVQEIITDMYQLRYVANLQESLEWMAGKTNEFANLLPSFNSSKLQSDKSELQNYVDSVRSLSKDFNNLAEICLLLLHMEVRVHCFYYLLPATKQSIYAGAIDDMDPDSNVLKLNKDLSNIEEVLQQNLQPNKFKYIFDNLGYLLSAMLINCSQFIKRINENGIKKMCRNILALQQNLTNITQTRASELDRAKQFYELLYSKPEDITRSVAEKGAQFSANEYALALRLLYRSSMRGPEYQLESQLEKIRQLCNQELIESTA